MNREDLYREAIRERYPQLSASSARWHDHGGQYSDILIVDESIVFRFPRYPDRFEAMRQEVQILRRIQGYTSLPVPDPVYAATDSSVVGRVFMGYPLIPGEPLWRDDLHKATDQLTRRQWAAQLAGFLRQLHNIPIEILGDDLPIHDTAKEWQALYADIRQLLYPHMRPDARQWASEHFENYLDNPHLQAYEPALRHGDFGTGNILFDPRRMEITGIVDFGFAGLGDPAIDIAAASTLGDSFFAHFSDTYPEIEGMMDRARFYRGTYALYEALHGAKHGDQEAFESGLSAYI